MSNFKKFLYTSLTLATMSVSTFIIPNKAIADVTVNQANVVTQLANNVAKPSLAPIIKKALPSVVSIEVRGKVQVKQNNNPLAQLQNQLPPEFRKFFEEFGGGSIGGQESARLFRAAGSGVIIDANKGYIVTNYHVVENGASIKVKLFNNKQYQAKLIGVDKDTDLAVIQIENFSGLQAINFENSNNAEVGDFVIAIGNPFDIGLTVTQGIVSALNRSTNLNYFDSYIQTDAAINSGNSGGALVDINGNLLGINTAIFSRSGGSVGIGYAIPSNVVKAVTDQLIKNGKVIRGKIGIMGNDITSQLAETLKLPVSEGAFITEVIEGSPAERAGLKAGDIVVQLNDSKIRSFQQFRSEVSAIPAGTNMRLTVLRNGEQLQLTVASEVDKRSASSNSSLSQGAQLNVLGTKFEDSTEGVKVVNLEQNSIFAQYGIKKGDILVAMQNNEVQNVSQLNKLVDDLQNSESLVFKFKRGTRTIYVTLTANQ